MSIDSLLSMYRAEETVCAPATSGGGAIAVIRVSGPQSLTITEKIFFPFASGIRITEQKGYRIIYGEIRYEGKTIDNVLLSIFRSPHSYTGEDSCEISCHASSWIQQKILEALIKNGALAASPGEFTQRAFLNGKLDLSQAEAVADLVASESEAAHRIAISQLKGAFSDKIKSLRKELLHFTSLIELELDFGEEDVEFADRKQLTEIVTRVLSMAHDLASSFSLGNAVKNGIPVVIAGSPNTGKSTLLNYLLNEEKAIVSEIPGTTRDAIEDVVIIDGIQFRFVDTAGIRVTDDIIENLGINRTREKIGNAFLVLPVIDINEGSSKANDILESIRLQPENINKKLIILANKTDIATKDNIEEIRKNINIFPGDSLIFISAKTGEGLDKLKTVLIESVAGPEINTESIIITNIRHYEALLQVMESLTRVEEGLNNNLQEDLIALDIRQAIHYLGEITGEITTDEILDSIFSNFCIGK